MSKAIQAQEIFRKVIAADLYPNYSRFMCHALKHAFDRCVITADEHDLAMREIQGCLKRSGTENISFGGMLKALEDRGVRTLGYRDDGIYTDVFYDWATKNPFPEQQAAAKSYIIRFPNDHLFAGYGYDFNLDRAISFVRDTIHGRPLADHHPMRINGITVLKDRIRNAAENLLTVRQISENIRKAEQALAQATQDYIAEAEETEVQAGSQQVVFSVEGDLISDRIYSVGGESELIDLVIDCAGRYGVLSSVVEIHYLGKPTKLKISVEK